MSDPISPHVLIVDDDRDHAFFLGELVESRGFAATFVGGGEEALDAFAQRPAEVAVVDINMPGMGGLQLISLLNTHPVRPAAIAITAFGSLETATRALRAGAVDYLSKPFEPSELIKSIERAVERRNRRLHQLKLQDEVDEILRTRQRRR